jgi:uncharacterized protein YciI
MFVILSSYLKPIDEVEKYLQAHRDYLEIGYQKNYFIASGPQVPRVGGVILSPLHDRATIEEFMAQDPFHLQGIAHYQIIEFQAVKMHPALQSF